MNRVKTFLLALRSHRTFWLRSPVDWRNVKALWAQSDRDWLKKSAAGEPMTDAEWDEFSRIMAGL